MNRPTAEERDLILTKDEYNEALEKYADWQDNEQRIDKHVIKELEQQIKELKGDIEKIRHITYATFGEGFTYKNANPLEKKIADIDKIIYPKYYDSEPENKH